MGDQRHRHVGAIQVAGKVEKVRLEGRPLVVEHRLAIARDAVEPTPRDQRAHGINALRQPEAGRRREVGGGEAELAAAAIAGNDFAFDEPVIAKKRIGLVERPGSERGTDCGSRKSARGRRRPVPALPPCSRASPSASRRKSGVPRRLRPKWKSVPMMTPDTSSAPTSTRSTKSSASSRLNGRSKGSTTSPSRPSASASRALASASVRRNRNGSGREEIARMRLEGHHHRRRAPARRRGPSAARRPAGGRGESRRNCRLRRRRRAAPPARPQGRIDG